MLTPLERRALVFIVAARDEFRRLDDLDYDQPKHRLWNVVTQILTDAGWLEEEKTGSGLAAPQTNSQSLD